MKDCAYNLHGKFPYIVDDMVNLKRYFSNNSLAAVYSIFHLPKNDFNNLFSNVYDILKVNGLFLFTYQIGQGEDMADEPYLNEKGKNSLYMCYHTDEEINDLLHSFSYTELFKKQKIEMSPSAINSNSVNSSNNMKNVVNTIQVEQNKVIRSLDYNNLIVNGIADSSKTTVALLG